MCQTKIARLEIVELLVTAASNRINFLDIPQLRTQEGQTIIIRKIQVFPLSAYANSQVNNAIAGMPNAEIPKAALCLYVRGEERIHWIPIAQLINTQDGVVPFQQVPTEFDDLMLVDWTKSYVQYSSVPVPSYVIPFAVTYQKLNTVSKQPV